MTIYLRLAADFFLILSILVFPYWVTLLSGAVFVFYFKNFYEYLAAALILDLLYGGGILRIFGIPFMLSVISFIFYIAATFLKKRIILYD